MTRDHGFRFNTMLLAALVAGSIFILPEGGRSQSPSQTPVAASGAPFRNQPVRLTRHAETYYAAVWGIEDPTVKWAESGEIIRFSFRVLDPAKAKTLNDKDLEPSLIDPQAGVKLVVPALENVGILRQTNPPEAGKTYWMAFSNSGRPVKPGHRVIVQIGQFHADGLIVE